VPIRAGLAVIAALAIAACSQQATPSNRPTPTRTATPSPTPAVATTIDHNVVYVARPSLPPIAKRIAALTAPLPSDRIVARFTALRGFTATAQDEVNQYAVANIKLQQVKVDGEQVELDFAVGGATWGVTGAAARALVQQLVYTATEEPGLFRARITQNLGQKAVVAPDLSLPEPLSRDDVAGYRYAQPDLLVVDGGARGLSLTQRFAVEETAPAMARLVIDTRQRVETPAPAALPAIRAQLLRNDEAKQPSLGKWTLAVSLTDASASDDGLKEIESGHSMAAVDRTPLRAVHLRRIGGDVRYELALDDLRPWRVSLLLDPLRIVVDVGGDPRALAKATALYLPGAGTAVSHAFTLSGSAKAIDGNVPWRMRDGKGAVVVNGTLRASISASALWGMFEQPIVIPQSVSGNVTLEVYAANPGESPADTVKIPLTVR
jgi:hypothetical protein